VLLTSLSDETVEIQAFYGEDRTIERVIQTWTSYISENTHKYVFSEAASYTALFVTGLLVWYSKYSYIVVR